MRQKQSSTTAENNAMLRAYESLRPEGERIFNDPYAIHFLPERFSAIEDKDVQMEQTISQWESLFPGVSSAIVARARFIDDCLLKSLDCDIRQLVILGAGYDTRALRFSSLKERVTIFELDHPSTQNVKLDRINRFLNAPLPHVQFIPIDFNEEELGKKLFDNGYNKEVKTVFIWEGVTYYLPRTAIDRTLKFIAENSARNSTVVFDYFPASVANGTTEMGEALALSIGLKQIGEEILFGIEQEELAAFMGARGFEVVENVIATEYFNSCFKNPCVKRKLSEMFLFAQVRVV